MHKDTAKWLITFAPISAFLALVVTFAPRANAIIAMGFPSWARHYPLTAFAIGASIVATVAIIVQCSRVLLAEADIWAELEKKDDGNWFSDAFSKHAVGLPLFPASSHYTEAETRARSGDATAATAAEQSALAATSLRVLAHSEADNARDRFKKFIPVYAICTLVILVGSIAAAVGPDAVTKPAQVSILMQPGTEDRFTAASGCQALKTTTAIAVGGLWDRPLLRLFGPGCPTVDWTAPEGLDATIVPK